MPDFSSHYLPLKITGNATDGAARAPLLRSTKVREITVKGKSSPKYSFNMTEGRASAEYKSVWSSLNIFQAKLDFCGYSEPAISAKGQVALGIDRIIPYPHPQDPNYLYADAVTSIEGDVPLGQDAAQIATYDEASMSVSFSNRNYIIGDGGIANEGNLQQYVTISVEPTGRYERIPNPSAFRFVGTGLTFSGNAFNPVISGGPVLQEVVSNAMVVTFVEAEISVIWRQVPVQCIPWAAIANCVGKCDYTPSPPGFKFLSSTYMGPILQSANGRDRSKFVCLVPKLSEPYPMPNGNFAVDINYRFKFYPNGANFFYNWSRAEYQVAVSSNNLNGVFYQAANFNTLFLST